MSNWDSYLKEKLMSEGQVDHGAIVGHDGKVWAATSGFSVSGKEIEFVLKAFQDGAEARAMGMMINDEKYFLLRNDEDTIYGKKGAAGVCMNKTKKTVCVGIYNPPKQAGPCNTAVAKMASFVQKNE